MATLYIAEFNTIRGTSNFPVQAALAPPITEQTLAIGASSVPSAAFNTNTKFVRIATDSTCSIKFGSNPTVTAANMRLAAGQTEYFGVVAGQKVAVITNS